MKSCFSQKILRFSTPTLHSFLLHHTHPVYFLHSAMDPSIFQNTLQYLLWDSIIRLFKIYKKPLLSSFFSLYINERDRQKREKYYAVEKSFPIYRRLEWTLCLPKAFTLTPQNTIKIKCALQIKIIKSFSLKKRDAFSNPLYKLRDV